MKTITPINELYAVITINPINGNVATFCAPQPKSIAKTLAKNLPNHFQIKAVAVRVELIEQIIPKLVEIYKIAKNAE